MKLFAHSEGCTRAPLCLRCMVTSTLISVAILLVAFIALAMLAMGE